MSTIIFRYAKFPAGIKFMLSDAWAIGFYSYKETEVGPAGFQLVHAALVDALKKMRIPPTYFSYSDPEFRSRGKFTKWNGKTHRRILETGFANVALIGIAATHPASIAPAYESFARASFDHLRFRDATMETKLVLVVEPERFAFGESAFEEILLNLATLLPWEFGYAFIQKGFLKAEGMATGFGTEYLTAEEERQFNAWYHADGETKTLKLLDVFPYMLLSPSHLNQRVLEQTLANILVSDNRATLLAIPNTSLHLWKGPPNVVDSLRTLLKPTGLLI